MANKFTKISCYVENRYTSILIYWALVSNWSTVKNNVVRCLDKTHTWPWLQTWCYSKVSSHCNTELALRPMVMWSTSGYGTPCSLIIHVYGVLSSMYSGEPICYCSILVFTALLFFEVFSNMITGHTWNRVIIYYLVCQSLYLKGLQHARNSGNNFL